MNKDQTLIERVSSYENLFMAFKECSRGKKSKKGYQNYLIHFAEQLKSIEQELQRTGNYHWSGYKEFIVNDPKKRLVMAAPFRDRIVHTAIHRVVSPIIDPLLGARTYACRLGMGNRLAAQRLFDQLKMMGKKRYCIKLDVQKYFESIAHAPLREHLLCMLPDATLFNLLSGLLNSHPRYAERKRGIPIGNLTSQLFANLYLSKVDYLVCDCLNICHGIDKKEKHACYIRYMDDMVILSDSKSLSINTAKYAVENIEQKLQLKIPPEKFIMLASDPIPFLGFVFDESGYRTLRRNERKFIKKLKRVTVKGGPLSLKAQMIMSYEAWQRL